MAYIVGTSNDETLTGSTGDDAMYALGGMDALVSSAGYDTMNGGDGYDTFTFKSVSEAYYDRIEDFQHVWDAIDVSAIDAKGYSWSSPSTWGNNTFAFKGNVANAGLGKGELGFQYINGDTMIFGNTDDDGSYELVFTVTGYHYFSAADFAL
jgi:Ca2+-binding RTX toxin-like protein